MIVLEIFRSENLLHTFFCHDVKVEGALKGRKTIAAVEGPILRPATQSGE